MDPEGGGGLDGGQIDMAVVADLSKIERRKLQRQIDKRVEGVRARIVAEIDTRRVTAEAEAAAELAEKVAEVRLRAAIDGGSLKRDLAGVLRGVQASAGDVRVEVTPEVDAGRLRAEVDAAARDANASVDVHVDADADSARAEIAALQAELAALREEIERRPVTIGVKVDPAGSRTAFTVLAALGKAAAAVGGVGLLGAAAGAAAGGLIALATSAAQAVNILGLVPGAAVLAAQGLGALVLGFAGIGAAVGELGQAQSAGGASAKAYAAAQEAAADRIKAARRAIRDAAEASVAADEGVIAAQARVAAARARVAEVAAASAERMRDAARSVEVAERRVSDSYRAEQRALESLNDARKAAKERLEDLALAAKGSALDEESAQLAIRRAKENLDKTKTDPFASDLDKDEADLAYRQALQRLEEVKERNGDLAQEKADADAKGVEGSDEVKAALERIQQAQQASRDAEYALGEAREEAARAAVEAAKSQIAAAQDVKEAERGVLAARRDAERAVERLRDAEIELRRAQRDAKDAGKQQAAGAASATKEYDKLTAAGQRFAKFVHDTLKPAGKAIKDAVQEAMLPGVQAGLEKSLGLLKVVERGMGKTGKAIGDVFRKDLGSLVSDEQFKIDISNIMDGNAEATGRFGRGAISILSGVRNVVRVSTQFVVRFSKKIEEGAQTFEDWTDAARRDGSLEDFFERAWSAASKVWRIVKNVAGGLLGLGEASSGSGNTLMEDLAQAAERFNRWANDPAVQERLQKFFDDLVPVMRLAGRLLLDVATFLGTLTESVLQSGELEWLLGVLRSIVQTLTGWSDTPVIGTILRWLLILGALAMIVGVLGKRFKFMRKMIMALVKPISLLLKPLGALAAGIAKITGLSKLLGKGGGGGDDSKEQDKDKSRNRSKGGGSGGSGDCDCSSEKKTSRTKTSGGGCGCDCEGGGGGKGRPRSSQGGGQGGSSPTGDGDDDRPQRRKRGRRAAPSSGGDDADADAPERGKGRHRKTPAPKASAPRASAPKGGAGGGGGGAGGIISRVVGAAKTGVVELGKFSVALAKAGGSAVVTGLSNAGKAIGAASGLAAKGAAQAGTLALSYGKVALQAGLAATKQTVMAVATGVIRVATVAWTAVQWLLNAALNANPISLIVLAIAGLVAGVVYAYNNVEWFRKGVDTAWKAISGAFTWAWNSVIKPALTQLVSFLVTQLAPKIAWLWANVVKPTWDFISKGISEAWTKVIQPALRGFMNFLGNDLAPKITWLWHNIIKPAWDGIGKILSDAWNKIIKPPLTDFWNFITKTLPNGFTTGVAAVAKIWKGLEKVAKDPVSFVVNTVYNKGLLPAWNWIAEKVNLPQLKPITGFARGGIVGPGNYGVLPGYSPGRDSMLAAVSPGEAWLRPEAARWLGRGWIDGVNSAARRGGLPAFAKGGVVAGTVPGGGSTTAKGQAGGKPASSSWTDLLKQGATAFISKVLGPLKAKAVAGAGTGSLWRQAVGRLPGVLIDGVIRWFGAGNGQLPPEKKEKEVKRDRGGPLPPGRTVVRNATGRDEWVLTPDAVAALGGPRAVQALNDHGAAGLYRGARSSARATARPSDNGRDSKRDSKTVTLIVNPQPGQDEHQIGDSAGRRLADLVR
ncbi:hypothetical protein [Streptosporangium sp. NPDC002524]|uniref:phage tail protein n=1 Tax=Streptosporangium sp. NPDC002524 TaxID=3154537 RepID=UPI00331A4F12